MNKKRKSFVLHKDSLDILDDLDDQQVANLFRAIKAFHNDENLELDQITKITFAPFKNQFIRDNEKYEKTCERRAKAGSKGGLAKVANAKNASKTKQKVANQANLADSKNKSDSDNDSKSDSESNINNKPMSAKANVVLEIFDYWCDVMKKSKQQTKLTPKRDRAIRNRLKDGYTVEQIKQAIIGCSRDPFSMGQNNRQKPFNDLELICRDGEHLERFLDNPAIVNNESGPKTPKEYLQLIKQGQISNINEVPIEHRRMIETQYIIGNLKPETMKMLESIGMTI